MTNPRAEAQPDMPTAAANQAADLRDHFSSTAQQIVDAAPLGSRTAQDQLDRARGWSDQRPVVSRGAAVLLAVGASAATAIVVRRRAEARAQRLAWLAVTRDAMRPAFPLARRAAPFGGAGGALLMMVVLLARARRAQSHGRLEELSQRLAHFEAQATSDRPRPRDLLLGASVALGLAALVSRLRSHPSNERSTATTDHRHD